MGPLKLLLDTCTLLWMAAEPGRLGTAAASALDDQDNTLVLSDSSVWELCLKWQVRKINLPAPPRLWVEEQIGAWRLKPLAIGRAHLYRVTELPRHHGDPFDRLLVAQAIEEGLTLVTPDPHIGRYPVAVIW